MQQPMPMQPQAPAMTPAAGITTEQIQKYLDENKQLIVAILENQNLGKLAECAQYQAQLQKNLLYLAAIADNQPQTAASRPQMVPPGASPGVGQYMSQVPMFPPRTPLTPQQMQEQQLQQQQQQQAQLLNFTGQMVVRPGMVNGIPQPLQFQQTHAANPQPAAAVSKQDAGGATSEPSGTENHRSTGADNDGGSD
ncbi:GRF1-interacting factor 3-like [Phragmites australis]|uniref:GRF1-interacting factor 3-like n=1 Tax=Phragmites australis TaxID=29695 RepID=UPI002D78676D|nr:GRF1-interacting factor 3-like [Phragmites australis]